MTLEQFAKHVIDLATERGAGFFEFFKEAAIDFAFARVRCAKVPQVADFGLADSMDTSKALFEAGGPPDVRTALCDLQPDGAFVTREDVEVRFSDSEKVVAVANQWLTSGRVTDTEISFGSGGSRWRIDRNTADASLIGGDGKILFMGSCIAKPTR